jgi:hypothetical protein
MKAKIDGAILCNDLDSLELTAVFGRSTRKHLTYNQ